MEYQKLTFQGHLLTLALMSGRSDFKEVPWEEQGLPEVRGTEKPLSLPSSLPGCPGPLSHSPCLGSPCGSSLLASWQTYPELAKVGIGGVEGLVVGVQQDGDDALLLLR